MNDKTSRRWKRWTALAVAVPLAVTGALSACTSAADRADKNLSKAAENFEVPRRIVGINGITGDVLWSVEGFCSYEVLSDEIRTVCLTNRDKGTVERTSMGRSDNVTFVSTQLHGVEVDLFQPRYLFRPENIVPNFDLATSGDF